MPTSPFVGKGSEEIRELFRDNAIEAIWNLNKPTIAMVDGFALEEDVKSPFMRYSNRYDRSMELPNQIGIDSWLRGFSKISSPCRIRKSDGDDDDWEQALKMLTEWAS